MTAERPNSCRFPVNIFTMRISIRRVRNTAILPQIGRSRMTANVNTPLNVLAEPETHFWADESGAVTTDELVLMAAVIGIGLLAVGNFSNGAEFLANDRRETLSGYHGISSSATNNLVVASSGGGDEVTDTEDVVYTTDEDGTVTETSSSGSSTKHYSSGSSDYTSHTGSSDHTSRNGSTSHSTHDGSTSYTSHNGSTSYTKSDGSSTYQAHSGSTTHTTSAGVPGSALTYRRT